MISIGPSSPRTFADRVVDRGAVGHVDRQRRSRAAPLGASSSAAARRGVAVEIEQRDPVPGAARRRPTASPMPDAAPVTTATRLIVLSSSDVQSPTSMDHAPKCSASALSKNENAIATPTAAAVRVGRDAARRKGRPVRIGLMIGPEKGRYREKVARLVADAEAAETAGFASIWVPQVPTTSTR